MGSMKSYPKPGNTKPAPPNKQGDPTKARYLALALRKPAKRKGS
jgi:hypothetical protein